MRGLGLEEWLDAWVADPHAESLIVLCDDVSDRLERQEASPDDVLAVRIADESGKIGERTPSMSRAVGRLLFRVGLLREARGILIKSLQQQKDPLNLSLIGQILMFLGDARHAAQSFEIATRFRPDDLSLRAWLDEAWRMKALERDQGREAVQHSVRSWSVSAPILVVGPEEDDPHQRRELPSSPFPEQREEPPTRVGHDSSLIAAQMRGREPKLVEEESTGSSPEFDLDSLGLDGVELSRASKPRISLSQDDAFEDAPTAVMPSKAGLARMIESATNPGRAEPPGPDVSPAAPARSKPSSAPPPPPKRKRNELSPGASEPPPRSTNNDSSPPASGGSLGLVPSKEEYSPRLSMPKKKTGFLRRNGWTLFGLVVLLASLAFLTVRFGGIEELRARLGIDLPAKRPATDQTEDSGETAPASSAAVEADADATNEEDPTEDAGSEDGVSDDDVSKGGGSADEDDSKEPSEDSDGALDDEAVDQDDAADQEEGGESAEDGGPDGSATGTDSEAAP